MNAILRAIFKGMPSVGDLFIFDDTDTNKDPFDKKNELRMVEVIETRAGWVRYKFVNSSVFADERLKRSHFNFCYRKIASPNKSN